MSVIINYIDYDYLPQTILQTIKISFSCNIKAVLRVVCNNTLVARKSVCQSQGSYIEEVLVPVQSGKNTCTISFLDEKESKTLVSRTIRYRLSPVVTNIESVNFENTMHSNTFILPGDYNVNFITINRMIDANVALANGVIGAYGGLTFNNKSGKHATASFCISGRCNPVLVPPYGSVRVAFCINCTDFYKSAMELDIPADGVVITNTPEYYAVYNKLNWMNSTYQVLSEYESIIFLEPTSKCDISYYSAMVEYATYISASAVDGDINISGKDSVLISGTGHAMAKLQMPIDHEIHVYLVEGSLEISAKYRLFIGIITCKHNV